MQDTSDPIVQHIIDGLRASRRTRLADDRNRIKRIGNCYDLQPRLEGEARVRLFDRRVQTEVLDKYPKLSRGDQRLLMLERIDADTGWSKNTVVDHSRTRLSSDVAWGSAHDVFIHEMTAPANVRRHMLQFIYANQTPSQIRNPDSFVADEATLLQTWTVQFPAPAVQRNINTVGLTTDISVAVNSDAVQGIMAYTLLSTTVVQSIVQVADVQYRVTWSLDA